MDESDSEISFDENGVCSHCHDFKIRISKEWHRGLDGEKKLSDMLSTIKNSQRNKKYDCVIGISGGVDSSYLLIKAKEWGLRALAIHVDAGWNSELAVKNIELLIKKTGFDLYTYVVDWREMKKVQRAFLKSGLANQDVPQDHIFFSILYKKCKEFKVPFVLNGYNVASESILPKSWGYTASDSRQIKYICKHFEGVTRFKSYKITPMFKRLIWNRYFSKLNILTPLNFIDFDKEAAKKQLIHEYGWRDYGVKHGESLFTKFFQSYYLPVKFGYDKRKAHLSSLILAGQISRDDALKSLEVAPFDENSIDDEIEFVAKKLDFSVDELKNLVLEKPHYYYEYPNYDSLIQKLINIKRLLKKLLLGSR